ncbi:MAG: nucleoside deaminase [Candidatus Margulisiibacteriota bacterium]
MTDPHFLGLAYEQAQKAAHLGEVPVGAVLVKHGQVIASGHNERILQKNSLYHAEIVVLERACKLLNQWRLDGCVLYVTLEPCLMCTGAIVESRVSRVVFSALDEKNGCVLSRYTLLDDHLLSHRVSYEYQADERSKMLLRKFFESKR